METLEDSVRQYTESLQNRIRELLTDVDNSNLDKILLERLGHQELLHYTDTVISKALEGCLKGMTKEVEKMMKESLKGLISEEMIRNTLQSSEVAELMTKALCKRVAASLEDYY